MRFFSLLFLSLLLPGAGEAQRPVRSLLEIRREGVVIQEWDISCGAATLATILKYHLNYPVTEEQVARGMLRQTDPLRVRHRGGFSLLDMKRYAAQVGFEGNGYTGMAIQDLEAQVPMIIPIRVRGYDHFVVVRGVTDEGVRVADPGYGNYRMSHRRFARAWSGVGFKVTRRSE